MRDIKFRAWSEREKKMFNVDVLAISECTWDCSDFGKRGVSLAYQSHIQVMQFIGLKDKNDKEIYEGDILEADFIGSNAGKYRNKVYWKEDDAAFYFANSNMWTWENIEIIGDIYRNPELLKP